MRAARSERGNGFRSGETRVAIRHKSTAVSPGASPYNSRRFFFSIRNFSRAAGLFSSVARPRRKVIA